MPAKNAGSSPDPQSVEDQKRRIGGGRGPGCQERAHLNRATIGALIWIAIASAAFAALRAMTPETRDRFERTSTEIARFSRRGPVTADILFAVPMNLEEGDGVYRREDSSFWRVGQIVKRGENGRSYLIHVDPFEADTLPLNPVTLAFESNGSLPWVYEALLPDPIRVQVVAAWQDLRDRHEARFRAEFTPLLREVAGNVARLLGEEIQRSLAAHGPELRALADEYGKSLLQETLLPLLIEEVWPIIREHGEPPARDVGRRLWDAAPLFGFAWSGILDKIPITDQNRIEAQWNEFLRDDALPILREHQPMLEAAAAEILRDVLTNTRVRGETTEAIIGLLKDGRVQDLLKELAKDVARSEALRDYLTAVGEDSRVTSLSSWVGDEFDTLYRAIGNLIVLEEPGGPISPHFANFLRTLVLKKDRRWILLEAPDGALADPRADVMTSGFQVPRGTFTITGSAP